MPEPQTLADMEAERDWRLARPTTDFPTRADRDVNEDRIRRLDTLIAEARAPQQPPPLPPSGVSGEMIALALIFAAFAVFLAF